MRVENREGFAAPLSLDPQPPATATARRDASVVVRFMERILPGTDESRMRGCYGRVARSSSWIADS
jgi:hypothetical protein